MVCLSKHFRLTTLTTAKAWLLIVALLGAAGCAGVTTPRPSDAQIHKAIMAKGAWNPLSGRVELQTVQIEQIGIFNAEKKYWPVKAKVTTARTGQIAVLDFQLFKDDYGQWAAGLADRP
jgi:hypothetical protein